MDVFSDLLGIGAIYAQAGDKYTLKVPGGLAFSEFRGYESWETIAVSQNGMVMAVILGVERRHSGHRPARPRRRNDGEGPTSSPPQANDAKCGFACHSIVKARDYVFTEYAPR